MFERTTEEVEEMIFKLKDLRDSLPETNVFGENNWKPIDAQIDILEGGFYEDYEDEEYSIESAAYEAKEWLEDDAYPDLVDDEEF